MFLYWELSAYQLCKGNLGSFSLLIKESLTIMLLEALVSLKACPLFMDRQDDLTKDIITLNNFGFLDSLVVSLSIWGKSRASVFHF